MAQLTKKKYAKVKILCSKIALLGFSLLALGTIFIPTASANVCYQGSGFGEIAINSLFTVSAETPSFPITSTHIWIDPSSHFLLYIYNSNRWTVAYTTNGMGSGVANEEYSGNTPAPMSPNLSTWTLGGYSYNATAPTGTFSVASCGGGGGGGGGNSPAMGTTTIHTMFTGTTLALGQIVGGGLAKVVGILAGLVALCVLVKYCYIWLMTKYNAGYRLMKERQESGEDKYRF